MTTYAAFLRAINVGGRRVKMERLREILTTTGLEDVKTYLASGNVTFRSTRKAATLEQRIEESLETELGYVVETFVRTIAEVESILNSIPYKEKEMSVAHGTIISLLRESPSADINNAVAALSTETDLFRVVGSELFWLRRTREDDPKLMKKLERAIAGPMTGRNVKTLKKIVASFEAGSK